MSLRRSSSMLICGAVLAGVGAAASAGSSNGDVSFVEDPGYMEFSGRMIALPHQDAASKSFAERNLLNNRLIEYRAVTGEYIFDLPNNVSESDAAKQLMGTGYFEYVEPDWIVYPLANCPNDSRFSSQWQHNSMSSCDGWDFHTAEGTNVSVGICDTGVKTTHEDLKNFRLEGYNAVNRRWENSGGSIDDINGHGTMTTGCAAAQGNNGVGVSGMGWQLNHRMLRVSNSSGGGAYLSDLTHAALTAVQAGDFVASVSYSGVTSGSVETTGRTIMDTYGGLMCWAAGNEGRRYDSSDHAHVIIVGATTSSRTKSSFSNYGKFIDVMAPGSNVYTTTRNSNSSYGSASGTSFSCPLTAGLCALIKSADPSLGPYDVQALLFNGCTDMNNADLYGYGEINIFGSLSQIDAMILWIDPEPLQSGQNGNFFVQGGDPNTETGLFYSLRGEGSTYISHLGVSVDLQSAKQGGTYKNTDGSGYVAWTLFVPRAARGRLVWLQAAQATGRLSNLVLTQAN
ncbi:MAG: hypothetical protein D8M59_10835 [Planctomycetes bacterium]|nr:hypothetical protein [Planctomycetota bacterium]NOG54155.1 S8 family serine peptidase [Planctomycetota bacterium]